MLMSRSLVPRAMIRARLINWWCPLSLSTVHKSSAVKRLPGALLKHRKRDAAWLALRGASAWRFCVFPRGFTTLFYSGRVPGVCWPPWHHLVFVNAMANRDHSKSRSPVNAARKDAARMSQTSTVAAPSQLDALLLAPTPARGDVHGEWLPDHQQSLGPSSQVFATPVSSSPFAPLGGPT